MAEPNLMVSGGRMLDQTQSADIKEGAYGRPQIVNDKLGIPIAMWSGQRDRGHDAKYVIRQVVAPPTSMLEWLQMGTIPLVGAAIKYTLWACWTFWGWYAVIPAILLIGTVLGTCYGGFQFKDTRFSSIFKTLLVVVGVIL